MLMHIIDRVGPADLTSRFVGMEGNDLSSSSVSKAPWWLEPALTAGILGGFTIYTLFVVFSNANYVVGPYHSPFYSPYFPIEGLPFSPAILILWAPLGFRATCYYYRKAYYRAFFWDPPACAVGELRGDRYAGETKFPLILQNLHRFFFYLAVIVWLILAWETVRSFFLPETWEFYLGFGSIIFLANIVLLGLYTFSCHSFRHLVGGKLDCFSCSRNTQARHGWWSNITMLNNRHMLWAWLSLFSVAATDVYIKLLASGAVPCDPNIIGVASRCFEWTVTK